MRILRGATSRLARTPRPLLIAAAMVAAALPLAAQVEGDANVFLGPKFLRRDDWRPVEVQSESGIQLAINPDDWPVWLALNLLSSGAVDHDHHTDQGSRWDEGTTAELQLGVAEIWDLPGNARPFIAGGITVVYANYSIDDDATSSYTSGGGVGGWVTGGVMWTIAEHFNIGPQVGLSSARVEFDDRRVQAGGLHVGILLGGHW